LLRYGTTQQIVVCARRVSRSNYKNRFWSSGRNTWAHSYPLHYVEVSGHLPTGPLYPQRKKPRYPLNRRMVERFGEEKYPLSLLGFEPQTVQPVA